MDFSCHTFPSLPQTLMARCPRPAPRAPPRSLLDAHLPNMTQGFRIQAAVGFVRPRRYFFLVESFHSPPKPPDSNMIRPLASFFCQRRRRAWMAKRFPLNPLYPTPPFVSAAYQVPPPLPKSPPGDPLSAFFWNPRPRLVASSAPAALSRTSPKIPCSGLVATPPTCGQPWPRAF